MLQICQNSNLENLVILMQIDASYGHIKTRQKLQTSLNYITYFPEIKFYQLQMFPQFAFQP